MSDRRSMKSRVAGTLKWNTVDKLASQVLYAITGVVLARLLSQEDFGLIGAILVFQAFASLFVDSGFAYALLQRKDPQRIDYSTVFWFNMSMACALYVILYFCAPFIATLFGGDERLVPLARVMFLSFIINATAIVQINVLMKKMDVKMVAVSNTVGLVAGGVTGICLAFAGYGAWAMVWQALVLAAVKSGVLWTFCKWRPMMEFSWETLRSFFKVGVGVMLTSALNTVFVNIYSFFIGARNGLVSLGYYTQADKWSKMGISSLSQILNTSFLPALADYQDSPVEFAAAVSKMHRLSAYLLFPAVGFLSVMATPLFHVLFGTKWDPAIVLFQLLLVRGIFTVLSGLYGQFCLARGNSRVMLVMEALRDVLALGALVASLPYLSWSRPGALCYGIEILLWGQTGASAISWVAALIVTARLSWRTAWQFVVDLIPYIAETLVIMAVMWSLSLISMSPWLLLPLQGIIALALYIGINAAAGSRIQRDVLSHLLK